MSNVFQQGLLEYLIFEGKVNLSDIMLKFSLSKSEAIHLINDINDIFENDVIISNRQGIYMTEKTKLMCYKRFFRNKVKLFHYHEIDERIPLIIIKLLIAQENISLQHLADFCLVSRNTILNDMKTIKEILEEKGLDMTYTRKGGYLIEGAEFKIRNMLVTMVKELLNAPGGKILLDEKQVIDLEKMYMLRRRLENVENRIGIKLTDQQLEDLPIILKIIIDRARKYNGKWTFEIEKYGLKNTLEFSEIKSMFWDYECLNDTDLLYLSLQIMSSNMIESGFHVSESSDLSIATDLFIENIESYLAIQILHKSDLKEKLILHMGPAIYRNLLGFQINNPLTNEFIDEYKDIYNVVEKSVEPYEQLINGKLSKEEIVYLSMIVLSGIHRTKKTEKFYKAVVLCQNGTSVSKLLITSLKQMFPQIDFIGAYAVRQYPHIEEEVDFIFTTVPLETNTTTYVVPSILDKKARSRLKKQVYQEIQGNKVLNTEKLLASIREFIPEDHIPEVKDRVENFFDCQQSKDEINKIEEKNTIFKFTQDHVQVIEDKVPWDDLVEVSMEALLKRGSITNDYVDVTKKLFSDNYKNMVIANNVYLPHASPEYGVVRMDFQIVVFKNPACIQNNRSLKVIVALAPDKENRHVPTLIKLNNLFNDECTFLEIYHANSTDEIIEVLNRQERR